MLSNKVSHGQRVERDSRRRRKDGTLFRCFHPWEPLFFHGGKQMASSLSIADISSRKKTEEELDDPGNFFEKLFNSAPEAMSSTTTMTCGRCERGVHHTCFGYSHAEAVWKTHQRPRSVSGVQRRGGLFPFGHPRERVGVGLSAARKDGSLIDVSILGAPVSTAASNSEFIAFTGDITERKKAEEARIPVPGRGPDGPKHSDQPSAKADPISRLRYCRQKHTRVECGGDYFDFIRLDEHRLGDWCRGRERKRSCASLVMANLQANDP